MGLLFSDAGRRGGEQPLERRPRPRLRPGVAEQAPVVVEAEDDRVQLERELGAVELRPEVTLVDRQPRAPRERLEEPALGADEEVARAALPVVELRRRGDEEAAARRRRVAAPPQPAFEQPLDPR